MEVGTDQQYEFLRNWQRAVYEAGYLGITWPKIYGGQDLPQALQSVVDQEMAAARVLFLLNTIGLNWAGPLIVILSAEDIWCQGFPEPDHGSDLGNAQCSAAKDGDDYVINGSKIWTSLGTYAKYMILIARNLKKARTST